MRKNFISENECIMYIIKNVFGANSKETAVSLEDVINKGIELGYTEDWPIDHVGHPWYPHVSLMMGIGCESAVMENEEKSLHRFKMRTDKGTMAYGYYVDNSSIHSTPNKKVNNVINRHHHVVHTPIRPVVVNETFNLGNGRNLSKSWVLEHPKQASKIYSGYPEVVQYLKDNNLMVAMA